MDDSAQRDIEYMQLAMEQARLAGLAGEVPVGAVLLTDDGQCFVGHNAPISQHDASAHAEMQVIRKACAAIGNYRLTDSTLYVTLEPCAMCAGCIVHARIGRVVYGAGDAKTGAVASLYQLLSDQRLNHQVDIKAGILADAAGALLKQFFRDRRSKK